MGFLDKVKEGAAQAGAAAKDAAQKGQAKLDVMQATKAADAMLRDLGVAIYAEHTGRGTPATEASAERLVAALQQHEAEHGALDITFESSAAADPAAAAAAGVPTAADAGVPAAAPPAAAPPAAAPPAAAAAPAPAGPPASAPVDSAPPPLSGTPI